jgi:hypothetical protein
VVDEHATETERKKELADLGYKWIQVGGVGPAGRSDTLPSNLPFLCGGGGGYSFARWFCTPLVVGVTTTAFTEEGASSVCDPVSSPPVDASSCPRSGPTLQSAKALPGGSQMPEIFRWSGIIMQVREQQRRAAVASAHESTGALQPLSPCAHMCAPTALCLAVPPSSRRTSTRARASPPPSRARTR